MPKRKKLFIAAIIAVACLVLFISLSAVKKRSLAASQKTVAAQAIRVETVVAKVVSLVETGRVPITLNPYKEASLSFKMGGRVKQIKAQLGTWVKEGTVLARLDGGDLENQIKQANAALAVAEANLSNLKAGSRPQNLAIYRAQLQQAQANLDVQSSNLTRIKELLADGLASQQQYEAAAATCQAAQAQVKVAEESLSMAESGPSAEMIRVAEAQVQQARVAGEIAESQRDNLVITAPFAGYITAVRINEGEMAAPGMPLIGLADLGKFFACGYVGQDLAAVLSPGAKATVNVGTGGDKIVLAGEIVAVSPSADPVLKTYLIKVLCFNKNNKLKGGMMGEALLTLRRSGAGHPAVPRDAILEESGRTLVYVAARGKAVARSIVTGVDDGAMVEIISGVSPGDRIVVAGQHLLQDGAPVEVK